MLQYKLITLECNVPHLYHKTETRAYEYYKLLVHLLIIYYLSLCNVCYLYTNLLQSDLKQLTRVLKQTPKFNSKVLIKIIQT